jgi:hypothetical protein
LAFEGLNQPLDNILQGLPSWALKEVESRPTKQHLDAHRAQVRYWYDRNNNKTFVLACLCVYLTCNVSVF